MVENLDEALAIIEGQIDSKQSEKFEVLSRLQGQIEDTSAYVNKTRAKEAALKATVEKEEDDLAAIRLKLESGTSRKTTPKKLAAWRADVEELQFQIADLRAERTAVLDNTKKSTAKMGQVGSLLDRILDTIHTKYIGVKRRFPPAKDKNETDVEANKIADAVAKKATGEAKQVLATEEREASEAAKQEAIAAASAAKVKEAEADTVRAAATTGAAPASKAQAAPATATAVRLFLLAHTARTHTHVHTRARAHARARRLRIIPAVKFRSQKDGPKGEKERRRDLRSPRACASATKERWEERGRGHWRLGAGAKGYTGQQKLAEGDRTGLHREMPPIVAALQRTASVGHLRKLPQGALSSCALVVLSRRALSSCFLVVLSRRAWVARATVSAWLSKAASMALVRVSPLLPRVQFRRLCMGLCRVALVSRLIRLPLCAFQHTFASAPLSTFQARS
jgi:hypothetical protein